MVAIDLKWSIESNQQAHVSTMNCGACHAARKRPSSARQGGKTMKYRKFLAAMALASGFAAQPTLAQDLTLEFVVWNYSLETIQDNVTQFEQANPGIKVKVTDYAWPDYHDSLILSLRGNTPTDAIYGGPAWPP